MKTVLGFLRALRPADLILPAGAALVSAGLQSLVDREHRQRQRLAALDELVEMHRAGLARAGVDLSDPVWRDEAHPLDIDGAVGIILARHATEPKREETDAGDSRSADYRIAGNRNPAKARRRLKALAVLALGGAAGVTVFARGYARTYGQEPTVPGFLSALHLSGMTPTGGWPGPADEDAPPPPDHPFEPIETHEVSADEILEHGVDVDQAVDGDAAAAVEGVIGQGRPPLEECGWLPCTWTSDATRNEMSQRTAAAVHRNRCIHRPAGAVVPE